MSGTDTVAYRHRWDSGQAWPGSPITADEARERAAAGEEFTAIVPRAGRPHPALVTVVWQQDYAATAFLDEHGRQAVRYVFRREDDRRLFLHTVWRYDYPDGRPGLPLSACVRKEQVVIGTGGRVTRVVTDKRRGTKETVESTGVPVDTGWEPVPEFGDRASIARFERSAPP